MLTCGSLTLDFFKPALLGRASFKHDIINKAPLTVNDDVVSNDFESCHSVLGLY